MNVKDLSNRRFGKLLAMKVERKSNNGNLWLCKCDCGSETIVLSSNLLKNHTLSCGCLRKEKVTKLNTTHGLRHSRLYGIWTGMKTRCNNKKSEMYYAYGEKGIQVCEEWNEFKAFYDWAMSNGYNDKLTIDRKDNDNGYSPLNCKWSNGLQQSRNRTVTLSITDGENIYSIKEIADKYKVSYHSLYKRLKKNNEIIVNGKLFKF